MSHKVLICSICDARVSYHFGHDHVAKNHPERLLKVNKTMNDLYVVVDGVRYKIEGKL